MSMDVSQSKIKTWRQCRKQYYYKYVMKITKKFKPFPLLRGSIIHEMMESHYKGKDPWKSYKLSMKEHAKAIRLNPEEYGSMPEDLKMMMEGYFKFYKNEKLKPMRVEYEFRTKLVNDIFITGKIDLIARDQKLNWMVEHKCHNVIPSGSIVPYSNLQSALYVWVWNKEEDKKLDGVMWNYLSGKVPSRPQLLKNGEMSRRSSGTTWTIYRDELLKAGLDPKDYRDMREQLAGNEEQFFQRKFVTINKTMMKNIVEDTKTTALEIQKYAGKDQTRNLGRHCDYCEFKNLCVAQLKGLDDNYILKADFMKKEKKDEQLQRDRETD